VVVGVVAKDKVAELMSDSEALSPFAVEHVGPDHGLVAELEKEAG
jgi:hypothetical protein